MGFYDELLKKNPDAEDKMYSVTTGIIKENWDEEKKGKVKVEYIVCEKGVNVTEWIPVAMPYIGNEYGMYFLPEIGTEVVVAFNMGDLNCPIVIGSLWNQQNKFPPTAPHEENVIKSIKTKAGHEIIFSEEKDKESITIQTTKQFKIELHDKEEQITISDPSGESKVVIKGKDGIVSVDAKKKIVLNVGGKEQVTVEADVVTLKAGTINVEATQTAKIKGQTTNVEGSQISVKAQGSLGLESSGVAKIQGSLVKIN